MTAEGPLELRRGAGVSPARGDAAKLKVATSLESAKADELVLLDARGGVMDRGGVRRAYAWAYVSAMAQGAAWGAAMMTAAWLHPVVGAVGLGGYVWFVAARLRWQLPLKRALALLSARRYDEAHDRLAALLETPMPAAHRPHVKQILGAVTWVRGELQRALALFEEAIAETAPLRGPNAVACRWICVLSRAHLLVVMGRGAEVLGRRADLEEAPPGDFFALLRQHVTLALAFDGDATPLLPDVLTLHEWARAALLRNRFGMLLVYLSWAFARLGDEEMARHCLAESAERVEHPFDRSNPKLHAWMMTQQAAWGAAE